MSYIIDNLKDKIKYINIFNVCHTWKFFPKFLPFYNYRSHDKNLKFPLRKLAKVSNNASGIVLTLQKS